MKSITEIIRYILPAALLAVLLCCCTGKPKVDNSEIFNREVYKPEYASGFRILGCDGMKSIMIEVSDPWEGADSVRFSLLVVADGEDVPAGYEGQVLRGKARRIVAMSSTNVAMLVALGKASDIAGVSGKRFISAPEVRARLDSIADVGYEGQVDYEALIACHPDIVLLYGVEGANSMEGKLKELGIPYMYVGDYLEESPLGKAEWIVALAAITSNVDEGKRVYRDIPARYNALRDSVAALGLAPVKVLMNAPYADSWLLPPAGSYGERLIADAGGKILTGGKKTSGVIPVTREEAYAIAREADIWLNPGNVHCLAELERLAPGFASTRCVQRGGVFNNNLRSTPGGGNDYFESGVMHPDVILSDLTKILHPDRFHGELVYYHKLR